MIPIREVHELELSSLCNLACKYCPHPTLRRDKANIAWDVFELALRHVQHYVDAGTQGELSLTGIGEAILHPRFGEALYRCREVLGRDRKLTVATNGIAVVDSIARDLAAVNASVYVSLHRPEAATPAMVILARHGAAIWTNHAFVDSSIDWAGQVEWHCSASSHACGYLSYQWAVIRQNGNVDMCCQDAHDLHHIGTVWDEPGTWAARPIPLCKSCHLKVPEVYCVRAA